jgi:hypothetical protein
MSDNERGLLDLSVELSTREITAGHQFAIFVLVKNPFTSPVWIDRVHVSLPSELKLAGAPLAQQGSATDSRNREDEDVGWKATHASINKITDQIERNILSSAVIDKKVLSELDDQLREIGRELKKVQEGADVFLSGTEVGRLMVSSRSTRIHASRDKDAKTTIGTIEIFDPYDTQRASAAAREVELQSSLAPGRALQPSSTAVYTAVLNVTRSIIFPPSKYRLQFSVNFTFEKAQKEPSGETVTPVFTNTVAHEIAIRPSVYDLIAGSSIGGVVGSVAKLLNSPHVIDLNAVSTASVLSASFTILLAVILSAIAIIFVARKSDAQSFISVEDFWGGLLIGFFVGYTGTEFFSQLTKIGEPSLVAPNP